MADKKTSLELLQKSENAVDTKDIRKQIFKAKALRDFDKNQESATAFLNKLAGALAFKEDKLNLIESLDWPVRILYGMGIFLDIHLSITDENKEN